MTSPTKINVTPPKPPQFNFEFFGVDLDADGKEDKITLNVAPYYVEEEDTYSLLLIISTLSKTEVYDYDLNLPFSASTANLYLDESCKPILILEGAREEGQLHYVSLSQWHTKDGRIFDGQIFFAGARCLVDPAQNPPAEIPRSRGGLIDARDNQPQVPGVKPVKTQ